jgi:uncharacterized protein YbjT (DUF2867 family)
MITRPTSVLVVGTTGSIGRLVVEESSIGVTNRTGAYNRPTKAHGWKRRSERLVRVSGDPYTIVRPGWFDYHQPDELRLVLLQGDTRHAGDPSDGAVARRQIAQVLVRSLGSDAAVRKTFELVAERGPAPEDLDALFAPRQADPLGSLDGARDVDNMPLTDEPQQVRDHLRELQESADIAATGATDPWAL